MTKPRKSKLSPQYCRKCVTRIDVVKVKDKYIPYNLDDSRHICEAYPENGTKEQD